MDIRNKSVATQIIEDIESQQTELRRIREYKAYKIENGATREYVLKELQSIFPESYQTMRISDISLLGKVVNKISKAYKDNPIRSAGESTEVLNDIYKIGNFNNGFKDFEKDFNRQKYGLLWVNYIEDKLTLHSLRGFESFIIRDQSSGKLKAVIINYPDTEITTTTSSDTDFMDNIIAESQNDSSANARVYAMWTDDYHAVWRCKVETSSTQKLIKMIENVPLEGNESMTNPLGMLPFVFLSSSTAIDLPFVNPLANQTIMYNIVASDILTASSLQGYGQLVLRTPEEFELNSLHTGMTTAINLPLIDTAETQADASYINANPDLKGMMEVINNYAEQVLSEHGITSGQSAGEFNSGLERLIANADVTDLIDSNKERFSGVEEAVAKIVQRYGEVYGGFSINSEEFKVIFPKSKIMISDAETLANIETRLRLGLMTKAQALQVIDPNLDENEAKEMLEVIKQEKELNMLSFTQSLEDNDADNEERS